MYLEINIPDIRLLPLNHLTHVDPGSIHEQNVRTSGYAKIWLCRCMVALKGRISYCLVTMTLALKNRVNILVVWHWELSQSCIQYLLTSADRVLSCVEENSWNIICTFCDVRRVSSDFKIIIFFYFAIK